MPAAASAAPPRARQQATGRAAPATALIPFTAAAHEHTEPAFDVTVTPGTAATQLGPFDVPAFGFLRHIWILVTGTGGALGGGTLAPDYPGNIFQSVTLADVNGAPIFGPLDGYATMWANIAGAYAPLADPRQQPGYVGTVNTNYAFRIPVELSHHDGLGSLANQNAASAYKVNLTVNPLATLIAAGAPTAPALRIRGYLEAWTLPNDVDVAGRPQAQLPPAHGTTQYWSYFNKSISVGANTTLLPRVGNLIRNLVFIARDATGVRQDTVFPDPALLLWDARAIRNNDPQRYVIQRFQEQNSGVVTRDTGVFAYSFDASASGDLGDDAPTFWLPTVQSTRLELDGSSAVAGSLQVITNDVAPVEVVPSERFVETSATGFHPQVGVSGPGVQ